MLFCVPSIPLRRLATPLEWVEVLTLLLVLLPCMPRECFLLCTLKIWLGATTELEMNNKLCEDSTGLSKDTCFSWILVSWQVAIWAFAYHPAGSCLSWCKLLRDLLVWITSLLVIFFLFFNYPCLFWFICSLHFFNHCYALVIMFLNWVTSHNSALQKLGFRANDILFWFTFAHSVRKRRKAEKIRGNLVTNSVFYSNVYSFDLVWFLFLF